MEIGVSDRLRSRGTGRSNTLCSFVNDYETTNEQRERGVGMGGLYDALYPIKLSEFDVVEFELISVYFRINNNNNYHRECGTISTLLDAAAAAALGITKIHMKTKKANKDALEYQNSKHIIAIR